MILLNFSKDAATLPDEDEVQREKKIDLLIKMFICKHTKQNKDKLL